MNDNQSGSKGFETCIGIVGLSTVIIAILVFAIFTISLLSSGCLGVDTGSIKTQALDAISPVVVLKGSSQYAKMYPPTNVATTIPTPTPTVAVPTPTATPAIKAKYVDAYTQGERWEDQWYRSITFRKPHPGSDASPLKPLDVGVVVYDHKYLDSYTWWSDANGQYYKEYPNPGMKFLFIFVHEEVFGDPKTHIPIMPGFNTDAFVVQCKDTIYHNDTVYEPVNRILEFDQKPDYYRMSRVAAFGYVRKYIGLNSRYGGWYAERQFDLYIGSGNAWDGYIVYQVPSYASDLDTLLVGNFGAYGNAYWRFNIYG